MSTLRLVFLLFLMCISAISVAGDIQVSCAPGLRVFLDGKPVGTSSAKEDGLFLLNVENGTHRIRVEKDGFVPQNIEVEVSNLPIEVNVEEFVPRSVTPHEAHAASTEVTQIVGNLVITSAPQNCVVEIDGAPEEKNTPYLSIGGLAAGEHTISFSKPGYDPISGVVTIQPGLESTVRGNLKAGKVEVIHHGKGSLRVMSEPMRCTVRFLGMTKEKTRLKLNLSFLPAGEHLMVVSIPGRTLSKKILILNGQRTIVEVSFMKGDEDFVVTYKPE